MTLRSSRRPFLVPLLLLSVSVAGAGFAVSADADVVSVTAPQVILGTQDPPIFPPAAKAGRFSGTVTLEVVVAPDGSVSDVRVVDCTHRKLGFEEASVAAVKKWKFEPARSGDEPIEGSLRFRMSFNRGERGSKDSVSVGPFSAGGEPPRTVSTSGGAKPG